MKMNLQFNLKSIPVQATATFLHQLLLLILPQLII